MSTCKRTVSHDTIAERAIEGLPLEDVFVFDMNGQLIMSYPNVQQQIRIPIKSGTYIVKVGDVKRMVIVT